MPWIVPARLLLLQSEQSPVQLCQSGTRQLLRTPTHELDSA